MKQIRYLLTLFSKMRNSEHFETHKIIIDYLNDAVRDILEMTAKVDNYKTAFDTLDSNYKVAVKYPETNELQILRKERNDMFLSIKYFTEGAVYHISPQIKEAGQSLQWIINKYKKVPMLPYASSIAEVYNMVQDLRLPENSEYIEVLKLETTINLLEEKNKLLETVFIARSDRKGRRRRVGTIVLMRRAVDVEGEAVINMIESLYDVNVGRDDAFVARLQTVIDKLNAIIQQAEDDYYQHVNTPRPSSDKEIIPPLPADGPPRFRMKNQTLTDLDKPSHNYAHSMTVEAENREAFVAALYPEALGAGIDMVPPEPLTPIYIEVEKFLTHSQNEDIIIGLVFVIRRALLFYVNPLDGTDIGPVQLMKDGKCIAILENLLYPKVEGWD